MLRLQWPDERDLAGSAWASWLGRSGGNERGEVTWLRESHAAGAVEWSWVNREQHRRPFSHAAGRGQDTQRIRIDEMARGGLC